MRRAAPFSISKKTSISIAASVQAQVHVEMAQCMAIALEDASKARAIAGIGGIISHGRPAGIEALAGLA